MDKIKTVIAQSFEKEINNAVNEIKNTIIEQVSFDKIKAVTFYASTIYNPDELILVMNNTFPNAIIFGCSSAGEIAFGKIALNSVVAMAFTDEIIEDIKVEVLTDISKSLDIKPPIKSFEKYFGTEIRNMDSSKYFGLTYIDGISIMEEKLLEEFGDRTSFVLLGGSAGDNFEFKETIVYANGSAYRNGAIITLIKSKVPFAFYKLQSFVITDKQFVATKVDMEKRIIFELDNRPAEEVYFEKLGIDDISKIDINSVFPKYPLGQVIYDKPFVRGIQKLLPNNALELACNIQVNSELNILRAEKIVENTKKELDIIKSTHKNISGMLIFNCVSRYLELKASNELDEYGKLFADFNAMGLNTYGEALIGHINQSAVVLVLE